MDQDYRYSSGRKDVSLILSPQSHPAFNPVKLNVKTATDLKMNKAKAPEKPVLPFMRYSKKVWDQVKLAHPDAKMGDIGKIVGQMWRDLSDVEKQEYINEYENAKAEYCEQLKNYHNSPQYQNFYSSVNKKKPRDGVRNDDFKLGAIPTNGLDMSSYYAIEPAEDDGIDDGITHRQVAANRYYRNHRLLNAIFNEFCVADNRAIVTSVRMEQLKKQVHSLEMHQEKLKQELVLIDEKNEAKKKRILEASQDFENELKKFSKVEINDDQLKEMYEKSYDEIQKQWKEMTENLTSQTKPREGESVQHRDYLTNLVMNTRTSTLTAPNNVTVVALQQVVETPAPPAPVQNPAQPANPPPGASQTPGPAQPAQSAPQAFPQQQQQHPPSNVPGAAQPGAHFPPGHHPHPPMSSTPNQQQQPPVPHQQPHHPHHHPQQMPPGQTPHAQPNLPGQGQMPHGQQGGYNPATGMHMPNPGHPTPAAGMHPNQPNLMQAPHPGPVAPGQVHPGQQAASNMNTTADYSQYPNANSQVPQPHPGYNYAPGGYQQGPGAMPNGQGADGMQQPNMYAGGQMYSPNQFNQQAAYANGMMQQRPNPNAFNQMGANPQMAQRPMQPTGAQAPMMPMNNRPGVANPGAMPQGQQQMAPPANPNYPGYMVGQQQQAAFHQSSATPPATAGATAASMVSPPSIPGQQQPMMNNMPMQQPQMVNANAMNQAQAPMMNRMPNANPQMMQGPMQMRPNQPQQPMGQQPMGQQPMGQQPMGQQPMGQQPGYYNQQVPMNNMGVPQHQQHGMYGVQHPYRDNSMMPQQMQPGQYGANPQQPMPGQMNPGMQPQPQNYGMMNAAGQPMHMQQPGHQMPHGQPAPNMYQGPHQPNMMYPMQQQPMPGQPGQYGMYPAGQPGQPQQQPPQPHPQQQQVAQPTAAIPANQPQAPSTPTPPAAAADTKSKTKSAKKPKKGAAATDA